jgi:oligopeptide transport system substrate-binding protein
VPGVAERWEASDDGLDYTFHLRTNARWSDGSPVTSADFLYSMRRFLDPRTTAEYAYQAWYIKNARRYSGGGRAVRPGDPVEVELNLPEDAVNTLRGRVIRGRLLDVVGADGESLSEEELGDPDAAIDRWTFIVDSNGKPQRFRYADDAAAAAGDAPAGVRWCRQVLLDFREVGVRAVDRHTIKFRLEHPTPFFVDLLGFYPLFPVQQACVEKFGSPEWTYVENIVCNGAFVPEFRMLRDRTRLRKSETYWNREAVRLNTVDVLAVESTTTALNLYLTGKVDWVNDVPPPALRALLREQPPRDDVNPQPLLNTYYYLLNTTRKPLDDVRVRRALSLALDRKEITTHVLAAGEQPAYSLVPPGMPGYEPATLGAHDVELAQRLLAEAGYPGGRGFPALTILYNTHETHEAIAQIIRKQWQRHLGIGVRMRNEEFSTLLNSQRVLNFDISRKSWISDYVDPNTYLDMFVTGGEQNSTGWGRPEYDALIRAAAQEPDAARRLTILHDAERMLMDEQPLIPIYFYVSRNLVKPYVRGFYNNALDFHGVSTIWIDRAGKTPNPFMKGRR